MVGLVAAVLLTGCDVTGTARIRSDDMVDVDLRVALDRGDVCDWAGLADAVQTSEQRGRRGARVCVIRGTIPKERLRRWNVAIAHSGEHIDVTFNPLGLVDGEGPVDDIGVELVDVVVEFPGQVVDSNANVSGNTVEVTGVPRLTSSPGLRAVALDHPGPPFFLLLPAVAFTLGGVVVGLMLRNARNREVSAAAAAPPATTTTGRPADLAGADASVVPDASHQTTLDQGYGTTEQPYGATDGSHHATLTEPLPEARTGWERPSEEPVTLQDPDPAAPAQPDHSKWAPPEDRA